MAVMCHGRRRPATHDFAVWHEEKTWVAGRSLSSVGPRTDPWAGQDTGLCVSPYLPMICMSPYLPTVE